MQVEEMYNISQHFKVKVTIRINVEIKVCHVFPSNWKVYELQTWYTDEAR